MALLLIPDVLFMLEVKRSSLNGYDGVSMSKIPIRFSIPVSYCISFCRRRSCRIEFIHDLTEYLSFAVGQRIQTRDSPADEEENQEAKGGPTNNEDSLQDQIKRQPLEIAVPPENRKEASGSLGQFELLVDGQVAPV